MHRLNLWNCSIASIGFAAHGRSPFYMAAVGAAVCESLPHHLIQLSQIFCTRAVHCTAQSPVLINDGAIRQLVYHT